MDLTLIYTFGMKQVKDGLQGIAIEKKSITFHVIYPRRLFSEGILRIYLSFTG